MTQSQYVSRLIFRVPRGFGVLRLGRKKQATGNEAPCPVGTAFAALQGGRWVVILVFLSSFFCVRAALAENTGNLADKVDFNREIRPILSENCYKCHGPDDEARKAKLRFDVRAE